MFGRKKVIPEPVKAAQLFTLNEPTSVITEQIKTIRTNLSFTQEAKNLKSIMLTSALASEGKSTIAVNLAIEFANAGKRVVLIDADLRRSTLNRIFQIRDVNRGLTNVLIHRFDSIKDVIHPTEVTNLYAIPSGPTPPNPAELIGSAGMQEALAELEAQFDLVIVDAPPILPVTDGKILASMVDGVVMVVRQNHTTKADVKETKDSLEQVHANILGVILNDVQAKGADGYYGYGYGYGYSSATK